MAHNLYNSVISPKIEPYNNITGTYLIDSELPNLKCIQVDSQQVSNIN